MKFVFVCLAAACLLTPAFAQQASQGPSNEKAQKSYKQAFQELREGQEAFALDEFKKADKQDGGHCFACQAQMIKYGCKLGDWNTAELAGEEMVAEAKDDKESALAHYQLAYVLTAEAYQNHQSELWTRAHNELVKALNAYSAFPDALFLDGRALANLNQDDAAKARFQELLKLKPADDPQGQRASRYIARPELARAKMAPPFAVTTVDGNHVSLDDLQGKVVLVDFWATWCAPCREALPSIREIAKKFQGEPLVILSVSLDSDDKKWKDFVAKNGMTWLQYRDGGFGGVVAKLFGVNAIPHTFSIDADGVLQDEHIGDAAIEGKLKALVTQARELQSTQTSGK